MSIRTLSFVAVLAILVLPMSPTIEAAEYPPQDHGGASLVLQDGDVIWGEHTGILEFLVANDAVVRVKAYDGNPEGPLGWVRVVANSMRIYGTIDATGSGYAGGGGGGVGSFTTEEGVLVPPCQGGTARYGDGEFDGQPGSSDGRGGIGGTGDGPFANPLIMDPFGQRLSPPAGYAAVGMNGDLSMDDSVLMGSGARGGNPYSSGSGCRSGGVAGGSGGGSIALYASSGFILNGSLLAAGAFGKSPMQVGDCPDCSGASHTSTNKLDSFVYRGAGGGILISVSTGRPSFSPTAKIDVLPNGTVKLRTLRPRDFNLPGNLIAAGRTVVLGRIIPGGDYAGADLTIQDGDVLSGVYTGIDEFLIPSRAMATVMPFDGDPEGGNGMVKVSARRIKIDGTLNGDGAGHTGGGGGGSYGPFVNLSMGFPYYGISFPGGLGGAARYGGGALNGVTGEAGKFLPPIQGGSGGPGDGPGRGLHGIYTISRNEPLAMGSGADGEDGASYAGQVSVPPYGGISGGSGGGMIELTAGESFGLGQHAFVSANGTSAYRVRQTGVIEIGFSEIVRHGASVDAPNQVPLPGERTGSGGGILLRCLNAPITLHPEARIESLGGGTRTTNGGEIILQMPYAPDADTLPETLRAAQVKVQALEPPPAQSSGFMLR